MFKNMKIGLRMGLSFTVVLALMIALIVVGLNQMKVTLAMLDHVAEVNVTRLHAANSMIDDVREVSISLRNALLLKDIGNTETTRKEIAATRNDYDENLRKVEELTQKDDTKALGIISKIKASRDTSRQLNNTLLDLTGAGKHDEALDLMIKGATPAVRQWIEQTEELIKHSEERIAMRSDQAEEVQATARTTMFILGAIAIALAAVIGVSLTLSIVRPLQRMSQIAAMVGKGDLGNKVGYLSLDEIGGLAKSFDLMIDNLKSAGDKILQRQKEMEQVQSEISEAVNILASSSSQILALTSQLAASTAETSTAITETTTTMEEVKQTSRQMSQRAAAVSETAQSTAQTTEAGRRSVEDTIAGMNKIKEQMDVIANNIVKLSEQSQTIGAIISSVNDLANQSNLLAVNASIEAAKAGEQGKGFAVVAQEVRSLAEQSKDATNQVRTILNDIQKAISGAVMATEQGAKAVEAGLNQSQTAGDSIGRMAEDIVKAAQAAMQISVSTNEQVAGIDQVSSAMESIKKATEQIVSSTRQSEESTKNLHELGMKLKQMVARY